MVTRSRSRIGRIARFSIGRGLILLVLVVLLPLLLAQSGVYWAWFHSRMDEELQSNEEMASAVAVSFQDYVRDVLRQERSVGSALAGLPAHSLEEATGCCSRVPPISSPPAP